MIKIENLSKNYGKRAIFSNFSYSFPRTGLIAIVGESGSGKSTLLNMIAGLDFQYNGTIRILNENISKFDANKLADFRLKNIGYVFQNFRLFNLDTVNNNISMPLDALFKTKKRVRKQRIDDILKLVGLNSYNQRSVSKLSGGEKQRVAIARALINNPKILLCDEPTGALDEKNGQDIFRLLEKISQSTLVVVATHDVESITKIADQIIYIKEKVEISVNKKEKSDEKPLLIGVHNEKKTPLLSQRFKLSHSFNKIKAKKYRSIILNMMLSLSLTGIGLSLIITNSVSNKINDAFTSIMNGNHVVVTTKNENGNLFSSAYSAPYDKVFKVYQKYQYQIEDIGVNYLVNFEDYFKDGNDFYIESNTKKISFPSYSIRNINDYKWLEGDGDFYYPYSTDVIDDDQVVLGLTYEDMVSLCYSLQIKRNFTSLGHYIYENDLFLSFSLRNEFWQYDDEQIFKVVSVKETQYPTIYHSNHLWNEIVFEEMMRMPSDDDSEHEFPWEMQKIYYLKTKGDCKNFLETSFYDEELYDYVFERTNSDYNPTLCKPYQSCSENRIYVYLADKYSLNIGELKRAEVPDNFYITTDYGYASYASDLFSGFSKNVFVSFDDELISKAIDSDTQLNNETNIELDLPDGVVQGNFLNGIGNGLRFSTILDKLIYGRKAENLNEIVISKGLGKTLDKETLGLGKYLEFAGEIKEYYDKNGNLNKEYNRTKLVVVGIVDEDKNYLYHQSNWTVSFFRDKLGVSSFNLMPRSIVFEFTNKADAERCFLSLKTNLNNCKIINPLDDLKVNIDSTLDYANTILISFSILAILISILSLSTVLMLNIIESKGEIELLKFVGIRKKEIYSIFTNQAVMQGLISFFVSAVELIFVDQFLSYMLGDFLNIGFRFSLNFAPIFVVFLVAVLLPFFISKVMLALMNLKKKSKI